MDFISEQDVYDYLGIDYADDMVSRRVRGLLTAIDSYLTGAIGEDYAIAVSPESLAKAKEIGLMLIGELYDGRGGTGKERTVVRTLLSSMMLHLQLDFENRNGGDRW
ncbi:MAG: hypothetical protein IKL97_07095 [Eggerthellaceae bacterium]|nr:hypothetical protein [Eggerthellaceae bacterium]